MRSRFPILPAPTVVDVERITALSDPVLRNLQITQCYHKLSAQILEGTGMNANWCTFTTWASKQAGQTIRKEDLARALEAILHDSPVVALAARDIAFLSKDLGSNRSQEEIYTAIWQSLNLPEVIEHTSQVVGTGNLKVFEEIGHEFARFYAICFACISRTRISSRRLLPGIR